MTPKPWSFTALSSFITCPRKFHAERIAKTVEDVKGEAAIWGEWVHKQFENRLRDGTPLPEKVAEHEEYMARLSAEPGKHYVEQKVALDRKARPCGFFDKDVWSRGIIDFGAVSSTSALLVDFKTGRMKPDSKQLKLFAIYTFHIHPQVTACDTRYYWTQYKQATGERFTRMQLPELWAAFLPDLRQYKEAFETDTWQPRKSGLCKDWCKVTECEFCGGK